ncbi:hypothetical protein [Pontibacter qinzhouensis]|nr:hypothetical protein [Pontibacter qinzhouensis]
MANTGGWTVPQLGQHTDGAALLKRFLPTNRNSLPGSGTVSSAWQQSLF